MRPSMTDADDTPEPDRASVNLKLPQASVSPDEPWNDDVLDRQELAATLTNLIRTQSHPFTISIHGHWGTGKTFLLQRWQRDLEADGFQAIYFNAWEDDFCDDPLLAILGQLAEYFESPPLKSLASAAFEIAKPLLRQTVLSLVKTTTGLTLDFSQSQPPTLVDEYLGQRRTKDELKAHLATLSTTVYEESKRPLVFIIDELDRCRPTFAIELLEKVKHIFDIQNMMFVFGINRSELCLSLQSIYGDIDSDVYLRRFFDVEFTLPDIDGSTYCRSLMSKFGLQDIFSSLSAESNTTVHSDDYNAFAQSFPKFWGQLDLSLRDIEACVALFALVGRNVRARHYMFPSVLGVLIPLKIKNRDLYYNFVQHKARASEVVNYVDSILSSERFNRTETRGFDFIESYLYWAEYGSGASRDGGPSAVSQLALRAEDKELTDPEYLSKRIKNADQERVTQMTRTIRSIVDHHESGGNIVAYVASLIDLHQSALSR